MDAVCLATIIGNFLLVFALIRKKRYLSYPWLFVYAYASLNEAVILENIMDVYGQTSWTYYYAFYAVDLFNLMLAYAAIQESWKSSFLISGSISIYLGMKVLGYAIHSASLDIATMLRNGFRFVNLACIALAIGAIFSKRGFIHEQA